MIKTQLILENLIIKNKRKQAINDYNYENAFLNNMFENEPVMALLM